LRNEGVGADASTRTNTRFYISNYLATTALGARIYSPTQLTALAQSSLSIEPSDVKAALEVVLTELATVARERGWQLDRAAKSGVLTPAVIARAISSASTT
ncbi:hypothetical protein, partial [Microbacterium sp.]|uniref:hypothetical protein n=1 Tax=Microbacterium sp. TaxID=51671 RepID=UPI003F97F0CB